MPTKHLPSGLHTRCSLPLTKTPIPPDVVKNPRDCTCWQCLQNLLAEYRVALERSEAARVQHLEAAIEARARASEAVNAREWMARAFADPTAAPVDPAPPAAAAPPRR